MKFTILPLITLMATPGIAQKLAKPLTVIEATDWVDGFVDGVIIHSVRQGRENDTPLDFPGETPSHRDLFEIKRFTLDDVGQEYNFRMERDGSRAPEDYLDVS